MRPQLDRIEHQHENHYLHRDIKPDNFLMGLPPHGHVLYVVDMVPALGLDAASSEHSNLLQGLSKRYRDPDNHQNIPFRDKKKLTGTPRYASINTHHGIGVCCVVSMVLSSQFLCRAISKR